ncbi:MAG: polyprenyl synthetase family protein [Defluviitaleaceae bacterium]|nr:polyprenyl synthetase family protein [Defluviitaleaceae bacterium]
MDSPIEKINAALERFMPVSYPEVLWEAMRYSLFAGGKRLRPRILLAVCEELGGDADAAMPFACGLEMIHTYSLIHDDLPAMDDDDLRRGMPSCHVKYGEAQAILAGDGLLNRAFEVMAGACADLAGTPLCGNAAAAMRDIGAASGAFGMVGGQVVDIISENIAVDEHTLLYIHAHKTAALICAAFTAGARLAGAGGDVIESLRGAGMKLGLAFQIRDDILDMTETSEKLGKPAGSDEKSGKNTYVSVFGMERARDELERQYAEAKAELARINWRGDAALRLADEIVGK